MCLFEIFLIAIIYNLSAFGESKMVSIDQVISSTINYLAQIVQSQTKESTHLCYISLNIFKTKREIKLFTEVKVDFTGFWKDSTTFRHQSSTTKRFCRKTRRTSRPSPALRWTTSTTTSLKWLFAFTGLIPLQYLQLSEQYSLTLEWWKKYLFESEFWLQHTQTLRSISTKCWTQFLQRKIWLEFVIGQIA